MALSKASADSASRSAGIKINLLAMEGIRSLNKFFLYSSITVLLAIILDLIIVGILFTVSSALSNLLMASSMSIALAGLGVLLLVMMISMFVFAVYAMLSLTFGIRDVRRSSMPSAPAYASISKWLKYLVIITAVIGVIYVIVALGNIPILESTSFSGTGAVSVSAFSGVMALFAIIFMILEFLFVWKLREMYRLLGRDMSQNGLNTSSTLLIIGIVVAFAGGIMSLFASTSLLSSLNASGVLTSGGGSGILINIAAYVIYIVSAILILIAQWTGYKATGSALRTA